MSIEAGNYSELDNDIYHSDPAISSSVIKNFVESDQCAAIFYSNYLDPNRPDKKHTSQMEFGSAAHLALLEPEKFDSEYDVLENKDITTKVPSEWKQFKKKCEEEGKKPLLWKEFEQLNLMAAQIKRHELAHSMLFGGITEHSFFTKHETTGLMLKARPDHLAKIAGYGKIIVDYKTTGFPLDLETQVKEAFNQKRYIQGAFHKYVVEKTMDTKIDAVTYVCQMKEYPYLVRCFEMCEEELAIGLELIEEALERINRSMQEDIWPDYPQEITKYQAPPWFGYKYGN